MEQAYPSASVKTMRAADPFVIDPIVLVLILWNFFRIDSSQIECFETISENWRSQVKEHIFREKKPLPAY
jgi:hypothetical protein